MKESLIYENDHFKIAQCADFPIPGYLIVSPKVEVRSLSEMKSETLAELGNTLALATKALEEVLQPGQVYCAKFGELNNLVHFHVFPRTKRILEEYLKENLTTTDVISGPQLLDWARNKFKKDSNHTFPGPSTEDITVKLRKSIEIL